MGTLRPLTLRERRALRTAVIDELARVEEQIASLTRSFDDIVSSSELANIDDEHDPEGSTIAFERAQVSALLNQARTDGVALREALGRTEDDDYGVCEICNNFIGVERMLALPSTVRCRACVD